MRIFGRSFCIGLLLAVAGASLAAPQQPSTPSQAASATDTGASFSNAELDQMMAPLALYPDSLLAQVLMAATYPGDVADAVAWSKAHKDAKGEEAVRQVANEPWDPSVQSLVAFPQLLATLGQDLAWVEKVGNAFLGQPEAVMASVQRLRHKAEAAGNLKSTEQQKVSTQPAADAAGTTTVVEPGQQTIIIESADPEVVYVPSYSSSVYGPWAYPAYPPYYYGYYPGGALFSFGVGMVVGGALWGDLNWGSGDIDIDIDSNFNRNVNRERTTSREGRGEGGKWQHNSANRDGVPYRDQRSREQFGKAREGAAQRDSYRGRDPARDASRDRARQSMSDRGFDTPAASNREARDRASQASRQMGDRGQQRTGSGQFQGNRGSTNNTQARQSARQQYSGSRGSDNNAFAGSRNPSQSRQSASRGHSSYSSSRSSAGRSSAGRQMSRPARSGGRRR